MLSFGSEAEEDETETNVFVQKNNNKLKSVHDLIDDPKLSKDAVRIEKKDDDDRIEERQIESDDEMNIKEKTNRVRDKLKKLAKTEQGDEMSTVAKDADSDSDDFTNELERERKLERQKKA